MSTASAVTVLSGQQAVATAERLLDPDDVLAAAPEAAGPSLAGGLAGTALLHARLAATDPAFAAAATRHWTVAAAHARRYRGSSAGTFNSPGGLAASIIIGAGYLPDPGPQQAAVTGATRWLSARALDLARRHEAQVHTGGPATPWRVYDAISGLAGTGRVLLAALAVGCDIAEPGLLAALETLTTTIRLRHGSRPGWWLPAREHPPGVTVPPSGAATTGMAHGIGGPLALSPAAP